MKLLLKVNSEKTRKRQRYTLRTSVPATATATVTGAVTATTTANTTKPLCASTATVQSSGLCIAGLVSQEVYNTATAKRITQSRNNNSNSVVQKLNTTSRLVLLLIAVIIIVASVFLYLEFWNKKPPEPAPIMFGNNYATGTFPNLGNGHLIVDRPQWGASELARVPTIKLKHPIPYVMITHIGVQSKPCYNFYKCSIKMRTIQDAAIAERNLTDIQGNFYVADDGNIYVGRGWDYANTYANQTLAITFMGDYGRYIPSEAQFDAAQHLLAYALTNSYITLDYKLVSHNQTRSTKSPGANIYREIKKWPHFYPCGIDDNPKCGSELGLPEIWNAEM